MVAGVEKTNSFNFHKRPWDGFGAGSPAPRQLKVVDAGQPTSHMRPAKAS
jgi:uncharacterized membrane protein